MKVLLLAGGSSPEREVSLTSGRAVSKAIESLGHELVALDPATGESFLYEPTEDTRALSPLGLAALSALLAMPKYRSADVAFLALHGGIGENGVIQNILQLTGIPFTGSSMTASAVAMHKAMCKHLMRSVNVPTPDWKSAVVSNDDAALSIASELVSSFPLPCIVKPNDGGSTVGLTKVTDPEQLLEAVRAAGKVSHQILIEKYIQGRELTVTVFDGRSYPVVEIKPHGGLYDYESKYTSGKTDYEVPADIPDDLAHSLSLAAREVYRVVGASGLARVDFLASGSEFFCLEINTLPGMTALSLSPMAMKAEGISFEQMIQMSLDSALNQSV